MKKEIGKILDEAQGKAHEIRKDIKGTYLDVKNRAMQAERKAEKYVRENPRKSVVISAAAGAAAGAMMAALRKKKH